MNDSEPANEISFGRAQVYYICLALKKIIDDRPSQSLYFKDIPEEKKSFYEHMFKEDLLFETRELTAEGIAIVGYRVTWEGIEFLRQYGSILEDPRFNYDDNN